MEILFDGGVSIGLGGYGSTPTWRTCMFDLAGYNSTGLTVNDDPKFNESIIILAFNSKSINACKCYLNQLQVYVP